MSIDVVPITTVEHVSPCWSRAFVRGRNLSASLDGYSSASSKIRLLRGSATGQPEPGVANTESKGGGLPPDANGV